MSLPLTDKLKYRLPEPSVVSGSRKTNTLFPTSGSTFRESERIIFHVPASGYLDASALYVQADVTLTKGTSDKEFHFANGAESMFERLDLVSSTGKTLESISDYNVLQSLLYNQTIPRDWSQSSGDVTSGFWKKKYQVGALTLVEGTPNTFTSGTVVEVDDFPLATDGTVTRSFSMKMPVSGLLAMDAQYLPVKHMSNSSYALAIQLQLARNVSVLCSANQEAIVLGTGEYSVSNVRLVYDTVSMSDNYEQFISESLMSGGGLAVKYSSWGHITGAHPANSSQYTTNYTINKRSLNTALLCFRKQTEVNNARYDSTDVFYNPGYVSHTWQHALTEYPSSSVYSGVTQCYMEGLKSLNRATFYASGSQNTYENFRGTDANGTNSKTFFIGQNLDQIPDDENSSGLNTVINPAPLFVSVAVGAGQPALATDLFYMYDSTMIIYASGIDVL